MAHPQIAAFPRLGEGPAKATRSIAGQKTEISRTIHSIVYDPTRDEIIVPQFYAFGISVYKGDADGDAAPIRMIYGPHTQLKNDMRLGLDDVHREIFVPQGNTILVFDADANGDVAPKRTITGPMGASALTVDTKHDLLIVMGSKPRERRGGDQGSGRGERAGGGGEGGGGGGAQAQVLIFNRAASGDDKPLRVITGPHTMLGNGQVTVDPDQGWLIVAVTGAGRANTNTYGAVFSVFDDGDVAPRWLIGGPNGPLRQARGVTFDPKHKLVMMSDKYVNGVLSWEVPELF